MIYSADDVREASENKRLLAQKANKLVQDDRTATLFSSPAMVVGCGSYQRETSYLSFIK